MKKITKPYEILYRFNDGKVSAHIKDIDEYYDGEILITAKETNARPLEFAGEEYQKYLSEINCAIDSENQALRIENADLISLKLQYEKNIKELQEEVLSLKNKISFVEKVI